MKAFCENPGPPSIAKRRRVTARKEAEDEDEDEDEAEAEKAEDEGWDGRHCTIA